MLTYSGVVSVRGDIGRENMLYKADVCLLEDIPLYNQTVSLAEPQPLRLSRRQGGGVECSDSDAERGRTQKQLKQTATGKKKQFF